MRNPTPERNFSPRSTRLGFVLALTFTLGLAISQTAWATDGVAEINHTCAVQTGCFAGDAAGYPVYIDGQAGRSYRLTSDLIVPNVNTHGILINTGDIGIDLNNFAITGAGCVGAVSNCTPSPAGTGSGIARNSALNRGTSVKNGAITGMGSRGVFLGDQAEITNLRVRWNGLDGINTSTGSTVTGNTVFQNGRHGINVFNGATVSGNNATANIGDGIQANAGCLVQRNIMRSNDGFGLSLGSDSAYRENVINNNTPGTVTGGVNMLANSCNGTATCP
jgi:hypothetical protein